MQIVIDIPERTYEQLKFLREQGFDGFETIIDKAVANGTPLPKGHGRLIDAKDVGEYLTLADVPTIIEADKEEE